MPLLRFDGAMARALLRLAGAWLVLGSARGCGMEFVDDAAGGSARRLGGLPREHELSARRLRELRELAARRRLSGYDGRLHGEDWPEEWVACGGNQQSPISLPSFASVVANGAEIDLRNGPADNGLHTLEALALSWPAGNATLLSNGYTVQAVSTGSGVDRTAGPHHLAYAADRSYSTLGENYTLDHVHMHWSNSSEGESLGSEHDIEGQSFVMEAHFVHYNSKYASVAAAAGNADGLFVVGTFFNLSDTPNAGLAPIVDAIPALLNTSVRIAASLNFTDILAPGVDLAKYVAYGGSLTSPGCYQTVTFALLADIAPISAAQLAAFRALPGLSFANWREMQKRNGRRFFTTDSVWTSPDATASPNTAAPTTLAPTTIPPTGKPTTSGVQQLSAAPALSLSAALAAAVLAASIF